MSATIDPQHVTAAAAHARARTILQDLEATGLSTAVCDGVFGTIETFLEAVAAPGLPTDERFWAELQKLWGWAGRESRVTPMNAVNLCPEPKLLLEVANRLRLEYNDNPAQQMRMARGRRVEQMQHARKALADGLNIQDPADLAIVRNASEANNAINCGFRDWRPGGRDNVVIWKENHPTNNEAWRLRAQWGAGGRPNGRLFEVREVDFAVDASEDEIARAFISRIDEHTRFVTFTEISNGNGMRIPEAVIKAIWTHIDTTRPDCHLHIDGTMSFGARPVDLGVPWCHSFISSAHKWFIGPKETGILYMCKDKVKNFMPSIFAYDYKITAGKWTDMPNTALRFEMLGQRDDVNIISLALTQLMWDSLGPRDPHRRVVELAQRLMERLHQDGWTLITPRGPERSWAIVRVEAPKGRRALNLYDWMYHKRNFSGWGTDQDYRLSPHIYNTMDDIDRAVGAMNDWRRGAKH